MVSRIMNIENAKKIFRSERRAYWCDIKNPKLKRRFQNRINKHVSRWKADFFLETAEDYQILARELKDMREGRRKKRKGRPRSSQDRSKRRKSERLANKRRNLGSIDSPGRDSLFDSEMGCCFEQVHNMPPSEDVVDTSTDIAIDCSPGTSSYDLTQCLSSDIGGTPESTPSNSFQIFTPQTMSHDSNIISRVDEIDDPLSASTSLHQYGTYRTSNIRAVSSQENIGTGNRTDFDWRDDAELTGLYMVPQHGDERTTTYSFEPKFDQSVVKVNQPALIPQKDLNLLGTSDYVHMLAPSSSLLSQEAGNVMQQLRQFNQAQLGTKATDLNSESGENADQTIPNRSVLSGRTPHGQQNELALLIEQCLNTIQSQRTLERDAKDIELRRTIEYLWNEIRDA
ncbi:hypothetical protein ACMFMG_012009 [Clarireedia jacksonii]